MLSSMKSLVCMVVILGVGLRCEQGSYIYDSRHSSPISLTSSLDSLADTLPVLDSLTDSLPVLGSLQNTNNQDTGYYQDSYLSPSTTPSTLYYYPPSSPTYSSSASPLYSEYQSSDYSDYSDYSDTRAQY